MTQQKIKDKIRYILSDLIFVVEDDKTPTSLNKYINALTNLLDNWISVEDELPIDGNLIEVYFADRIINKYDYCYYDYAHGKWYYKDGSLNLSYKKITHFKPRSQPPKE